MLIIGESTLEYIENCIQKCKTLNEIERLHSVISKNITASRRKQYIDTLNAIEDRLTRARVDNYEYILNDLNY